jgi:hypothetical protein
MALVSENVLHPRADGGNIFCAELTDICPIKFNIVQKTK